MYIRIQIELLYDLHIGFALHVHKKHFHKESLVGTCRLGGIHAYVSNSAIQLPISALYKVHKHGKKVIMFPSMYPDPDSTYN
jgi:hypothetical protein